MSNSKKISYSLLELAVAAEGENMTSTLKNVLALAREAEDCGYRRIWLAEHHNAEHIGSSATSVLMGYVAGNTQRISVGSGGVMLPNHSPLIVAEQFGTLAQLYPGRIELGLGRAPGTDPQTAQAIRSDFMQAAHSFPAEVAKIQAYFSPYNKEAKVRAPIAEGTEVPLYILGSSTDSAHLAAAKGLPYAFASHFASTHLLPALKIYRDEFQASEQLSQPYTMAGVNICVADSDEEAEALFTSIIRMFVGVITGVRTPLQAPSTMTNELRDLLQHPTLHQMLKYSFVGSKSTVKKQVLDFLAQTQVNELIVTTPLYALQARKTSIRLFSEIMHEINNEDVQP